MATFLSCTQFPSDNFIIQPNLYRNVEPHPFSFMAQDSIYMTDSCDPDTITLDESMSQYYR